MERLNAEGLPHEQTGIDYLVSCMARLEQRRPLFKTFADFFTQVSKIIVSYIALALAFPDMFNLPYGFFCSCFSRLLSEILIAFYSPRSEHSPCSSFVNRLVAGSISGAVVAQVVEVCDKDSFADVRAHWS